MKILIADRGEPAIRVATAAAELGFQTLAVYTADDADALHTGKADNAVKLRGRGQRAYADGDQILKVAQSEGCTAIHPGAGPLASGYEFAKLCESAGVGLIGPSSMALQALTSLDLAARPAGAWSRIAVLVVGDGSGQLTVIGDVDQSISADGQIFFDVSPALGLTDVQRAQVSEHAVKQLTGLAYSGLATLVYAVSDSSVTLQALYPHMTAELSPIEEVSGVDWIKRQLRIAGGEDPSLLDSIRSVGVAVQARVNLETLREDGTLHPTSGVMGAYEPPSGPGIRSDGCGYGGYRTSLLYDTALARVTAYVRDGDVLSATRRLSRALGDFRIDGVATNLEILRALLDQNTLAGSPRADTVEVSALLLERSVPRALASGPEGEASEDADRPVGPDGSIGLASPMQGTIVGIDVQLGDEVRIGQVVAAVEAMKLQHDIKADRSGVVCEISMAVGDVVKEGYPIVFIHEQEVAGDALEKEGGIDLDELRGDMREFFQYVEGRLDDQFVDQIQAHRAAGRRTARENINELMDPGSFREMGAAVAGTVEAGTVMGFGSVNADLFGEEAARVALIHNNYDVSLTTNGAGHYKQEPVHELVHDFKVPLVVFSEGEGKPYIGDKGFPAGTSGFDQQLFSEFAKLSGLVPLVGVTTGNSFAGNATLLACCDVVIATKNASLGMGAGPSVVEAVGLGEHTAEELGSVAFQAENGNVDIVVEDDAEAVTVVKKYLSYFQGHTATWQTPDQRRMRHIIPENRVRTYDMREIIQTLADEDSVLELRKDFGVGVITSLIRVEGRPLGLVANNPAHLAGAVDSPGADKGARFLQLCDAFDIPVVVFMDCPGIMVGPDHERTALVRHAVRMFNVGCNCSTAMFGVMVRKAYGLGVQAMCGGSAMIPMFNVAWPTAEFAGMNIDGAVKLSARRELMAITDPEARKAAYDTRVADSYETARAINSGARYVIDPAETRAWVARGLKSIGPKVTRSDKKRPYVDTW